MIESENKDVDRIRKKLQIAQRKVQILEDMIEDRTRELHLKKEENQELELLTYLTSHDLQEPLRTIKGFVEIIEEDHKENMEEGALLALSMIKDGAIRMSSMIKSLLKYSKLGRNRPKQMINTNRIIADVLNNLKMLIVETHAQISYDKLPIVYVHGVEWAQLFQNLIQNAIKFRKDGVPPEIRIGYTESECAYQFFVNDNGIGIDDKFQEKIFLVFQRLHSQEKYPGTGIGLANCKKIVELHGGKIWFTSQVGLGTTFYFTIAK